MLMKFTEDTELGGVGNTSARGEKEQREALQEKVQNMRVVSGNIQHIHLGVGGCFTHKDSQKQR